MLSWKKKLGISIAHGFEYYDLAVLSALQSYLAYHFFPSDYFGAYAALLAWLPLIFRFVARPFGGFFVGLYADKYGRRAAMIFTSFVTGFATLTMAFLPTYAILGVWAPILLFILQLLQAFSFGGENPAAMAYLFENSKKDEQARIGALLWGMPMVTIALSLALVALCEHTLSAESMRDYGWRIPILCGVVNIGIGFYFRFKLVELKSFKQTNKVRIQPLATLKSFLIYLPDTILFYGNTISSKYLLKTFTQDPTLLILGPIVFNLLFFVTCCYLGRWIDRSQWSCELALSSLYKVVIVLAVPAYALQALDSWLALLISQLLITLFVATATSATPGAIFNATQPENRIATMGLGINLGVVLVGSFIPMTVSYLSDLGIVYVGVLMACSGVLYQLNHWLDALSPQSRQQKQTA
jgi:MHS family proline/betaine transporter-like MFS transporter